MNAYERETTVNASDGDAEVRIWTAQRSVITRLRKHRAFTEVKSGTFEGSVWAEFRIPADQWNPATGAKRSRNLSEAQRAAIGERLHSTRVKAA
jgi:hypothetical protein